MDMAVAFPADQTQSPRDPESNAEPRRRGARAMAWIERHWRPERTVFKVVGGLLLTIFLVWLVLFVTKGRFLKQPFETLASRTLDREVRVGGDFNLYFAPFNVKFLAEDIHVRNPAWARDKDFFSAKRVETDIRTLPLIFGKREIKWIALDGAHISPEWDAKHHRNTWTFGDPNQPAQPLKLPQIERGLVVGTHVSYRDPLLKLFAEIDVDTVRAADTQFANDIRFRGGGTMREKPFHLSGGLLSPNETVSGGVNRLTLHAQAVNTAMDVSGTLPEATQIEGARLKIAVRGANLTDLFDFLGVAVPETRHYHLTSALTYVDKEWRFTGLRGVFGESDLAGSLKIGMPKDRLMITADLATNTLDIVDAGPFIGYNPQRLERMGSAGTVTRVSGTPRVLPDAPLRSDAISRFDAAVHYRVGRVRAQSLPVSNIDLRLGLDHSLLTLHPVRANVAGGTLTGNISLNARTPAVVTDYDVRLSPTPMGTLLARFGVSQSGTTGTVSARAVMRGTGDSIRRSLATSSGRIVVIIPQGTMWTRNIQLSELDIGVFLQKMFEKKLKEPVAINCGLLAFTVRNGIAAADPILIDTKKNVILGRGGFSFRNEAIDLSIRADAKTFSLFSGQSPVAVNGYFARPGINVISPQLIARAGIGLGLGIAVNPLAALIAFVDPGDAKAADCRPVLAGAHAAAMRTTKGKPRDDVGNGTTGKSESGKQSKDERKKQRKKFLGIF